MSIHQCYIKANYHWHLPLAFFFFVFQSSLITTVISATLQSQKKTTCNSKQQTFLLSPRHLYLGFSNISVLHRERSSPWQLLQSPCSKWMIKKRWRGFTGGWYAWHPKSPPFAPSKPSGASYSCPPNKPTILYLFLLKYWCMLWKV